MLKLTVEEALVAADYWSAGATFHEDDRSLRAICMVLAGEVRRLRAGIDDCEHMLLTEANTRAALERAEQMLRDLRAP